MYSTRRPGATVSATTGMGGPSVYFRGQEKPSGTPLLGAGQGDSIAPAGRLRGGVGDPCGQCVATVWVDVWASTLRFAPCSTAMTRAQKREGFVRKLSRNRHKKRGLGFLLSLSKVVAGAGFEPTTFRL